MAASQDQIDEFATHCADVVERYKTLQDEVKKLKKMLNDQQRGNEVVLQIEKDKLRKRDARIAELEDLLRNKKDDQSQVNNQHRQPTYVGHRYPPSDHRHRFSCAQRQDEYKGNDKQQQPQNSKQQNSDRPLVGTPMDVYHKVIIKESGNKPWSLSEKEIFSIRLQNKIVVYLTGIPNNECTADKLKEIYDEFGCSEVSIKENQFYEHHGSAWLLFNDKRGAFKAKQFANKYVYGRDWHISANYGLSRYCKKWVNGQNCQQTHIWMDYIHKWCPKDIFTTEDEREFRLRKKYGAQSQKHHNHDSQAY